MVYFGFPPSKLGWAFIITALNKSSIGYEKSWRIHRNRQAQTCSQAEQGLQVSSYLYYDFLFLFVDTEELKVMVTRKLLPFSIITNSSVINRQLWKAKT